MKKILVGMLALSVLLQPGIVIAGGNTPVEPTGAVRAVQYKKVLADCQKKYSGQSREVAAEWGGHYGRTGWWCVHRR